MRGHCETLIKKLKSFNSKNKKLTKELESYKIQVSDLEGLNSVKDTEISLLTKELDRKSNDLIKFTKSTQNLDALCGKGKVSLTPLQGKTPVKEVKFIPAQYKDSDEDCSFQSQNKEVVPKQKKKNNRRKKNKKNKFAPAVVNETAPLNKESPKKNISRIFPNEEALALFKNNTNLTDFYEYSFKQSRINNEVIKLGFNGGLRVLWIPKSNIKPKV